MATTLADYTERAAKIAQNVLDLQRLSEQGLANEDLQVYGYVYDASMAQIDSIRQLRLSFDERTGDEFEATGELGPKVQALIFERQFRKALNALSGALVELADSAAEFRLLSDYQRIVGGREGDTFQAIAARELGGWESWTDLVRANADAVNPQSDPEGVALVVPRRR